MQKTLHSMQAIAIATLLLLATASAALSQSIWLPPSKGNSVSLEAFKADWAGDNAIVTLTSSVWFLTGRYQANTTITFIGELPLSHFNLKSVGSISPDAENVIGNPYLGILVEPENSWVTGEFGVRLPSTKDNKPDASVNGWYSEFDRWEAFIPDLLTIRARLGARLISASGKIQARFLGGGALWVPTERGDPEVFGDALGQVWLQGNKFTVGVTLSARTLLTQSGRNFKERSEFQLGFGATGFYGKIMPGLHVHFPLSNDGMIRVGQAVDAVFGANITFLLGEPKVKERLN